MSLGPIPGPNDDRNPVIIGELQSRISDLERKISEIIEQIEASELVTGDAERRARVDHIRSITSEATHRKWFRWLIAFFAIAIIVGACWLLYHDMHLILLFHEGTAAYLLQSAQLHLAMFIAPVIAITSIVIVMLVGAFRGFKDDDISKFAPSTLASEAVNKSMSN